MPKSAKYGYERRWNNPAEEDGSVGCTSGDDAESTFTNLAVSSKIVISGFVVVFLTFVELKNC